MRELAYYDNGKIFKDASSSLTTPTNSFLRSETDGVESNYFRYDNVPSGQFDCFKVKKNTIDNTSKVKTYHKSEHYCSKAGEVGGYDLSDVDVAPVIDNIYCVGVSDAEVEIYFNVTSLDNMNEIALYYGLPFPLSNDSTFDKSPFLWRTQRQGTNDKVVNDIRISSIKFISNKAEVFKCYYFESYSKEY